VPKTFPAPESNGAVPRHRVMHPRARRATAMTPANCLRIARDLTIAELAGLCRLAPRTVARVMRDGVGHTRLPIRIATRICVAKVLGADPLELWPDLATSPDVIVHRVVVSPKRRARRRSTAA
jgi:AraC-like DNA-binding protein